MIVTSIIDNGTTIQLTVDGAKKEVQKDGLLVDIVDSQYIRFYLPNGRNFTIKFTDVLTPSTGSIDALRAAIKVMIDATTSNNLLQSILTALSNLKISADSIGLNTDDLENAIGALRLQIADIEITLGDPTDAEATSDTGSFSFVAFMKRIQTKFTTLLAKDFATSAKQDTEIATLLSIKDTAGIKKITDPLPVGTNTIGKTIVRGGDKGTTTAADVTSTSVDSNTQALDVVVKNNTVTSPPQSVNIGDYANQNKVFSYSGQVNAVTAGTDNPTSNNREVAFTIIWAEIDT